jgi:hypothetical protein
MDGVQGGKVVTKAPSILSFITQQTLFCKPVGFIVH